MELDNYHVAYAFYEEGFDVFQKKHLSFYDGFEENYYHFDVLVRTIQITVDRFNLLRKLS